MINLKFDVRKRKNVRDIVIISDKIMSAVASEIDCLIDTGARVPVWCGGV